MQCPTCTNLYRQQKDYSVPVRISILGSGTLRHLARAPEPFRCLFYHSNYVFRISAQKIISGSQVALGAPHSVRLSCFGECVKTRKCATNAKYVSSVKFTVPAVPYLYAVSNVVWTIVVYKSFRVRLLKSPK